MSPFVVRPRRRCAARRMGLILLAAALAALPLRAQRPAHDSTVIRDIAPGVTLQRIVKSDGPVFIHVVAIDLGRPDLAVRAVRACDRSTGRERPSAIVRRLRTDEKLDVVAAMNAGFFDLEGGTGSSESNVVIDGEIVKGVAATESPFGRLNTVHSQFGVTDSGRPVIDPLRLIGTVYSGRARWVLGAVNGNPVADQVTLYTEWTDRMPRFPPGDRSAAVPLVRLNAHGDTVRYRVAVRRAGPARDSASAKNAAAALLVGAGRAARRIALLREGDPVTVVERFSPDRGNIRMLVGGWPRIVRAGVNVAALADSIEGTFPRFSAARHPRSAVGISRDSATLYLAAVDGRQPSSVGMTLDELARVMMAVGAYDALNLDGGGSTALVAGDSVVNSPSDQTGERPVGDAIVVTRQQPGAAVYARRVHPALRIPASCVTGGTRDPDRLPPPAPR